MAEKTWLNQFKRLDNLEVVHEFPCNCDPASRNHERMVSGALRNMSNELFLDDGIPIESS